MNIPRRFPLWGSFFGPRAHKCKWRNFIHQPEFSRTVGTSIDAGQDISVYRVEPVTMTIQKQIISSLQLGERGRASNLLLNLSHENCSLAADDFVDVLKYCARSRDPLFAMETWKIMGDKEISPNNKCYLHMMEALCNGGCLEQASKLIKYIGESHDIHPSISFYDTFLSACSKLQSIDPANQCLDLMERKMSGKSEFTYSTLLKFAVWQQNLSAVQEIWKDYIKHYSPSIFLFQRFIWSLTRLKDLKSACETLQQMVAGVIQENIYIGPVGLSSYSERLCIPIPFNGQSGMQKFHPDEKEESFPLKANTCNGNMKQNTSFGLGNGAGGSIELDGLAKNISPAVKYMTSSFSEVIHACAQTQNCGLAEQLVLQMLKLGLEPSSSTYDGFIKAVVSDRGFNAGMELLKVMQKKDLKPYDTTLAVISIDCSRALELDLAEALLDQMSNSSKPHAYNAFFAACNKMDQPERAVRVFAKMKQLKVPPDNATYQQLFALFGNVNAPFETGNLLSRVESTKRIKAIEMDMAKHDLQHSQSSMMSLMEALGAEGMTREILQYLFMADNIFSRSDTSLEAPYYNSVLHSLVKAEESHLAIEIFKKMKQSGFLADAATYSIMMDGYSKIRAHKCACALLSLMLRDGFIPQKYHYTDLMKIVMKCKDFDEALNILDQGISDEVQLDAIFYNTIFEEAWVKWRIDVIEYFVERMHRKEVQPNSTTCSYVFCTYVKCGFYNTAVEALQVLTMRMLCKDDNALKDLRTEFEEFILSEDSEVESCLLKSFHDIEGSLFVALLSLRWCAISGFPISWSLNQTPWARRLSANYDRKNGMA